MHVLQNAIIDDIHTKIIFYINFLGRFIQLNMVYTPHELDGSFTESFLDVVVFIIKSLILIANWLPISLMELGETRTGTEEFVVELTIALVASKTSHILHICNRFIIKNHQIRLIFLLNKFRVFLRE